MPDRRRLTPDPEWDAAYRALRGMGYDFRNAVMMTDHLPDGWLCRQVAEDEAASRLATLVCDGNDDARAVLSDWLQERGAPRVMADRFVGGLAWASDTATSATSTG